MLTLNTLLFIENGEPIQDGSVGVEDQQSHIRQCRQMQYVDQGFRCACVELFLSQARITIALNVQQVLVRPWRADQFATDTAAIWQRKKLEQEAGLPQSEVTDLLLQIKHRCFGKVRGTDFPGSTVVSRFEAQAMDHGLGLFQGVQITEVMPLVEHFAHYSVDHLAH